MINLIDLCSIFSYWWMLWLFSLGSQHLHSQHSLSFSHTHTHTHNICIHTHAQQLYTHTCTTLPLTILSSSKIFKRLYDKVLLSSFNCLQRLHVLMFGYDSFLHVGIWFIKQLNSSSLSYLYVCFICLKKSRRKPFIGGFNFTWIMLYWINFKTFRLALWALILALYI